MVRTLERRLHLGVPAADVQDWPRMQVLLGPRQVGKTTVVRQLLERHRNLVSHYASADDLISAGRSWLLEQWQVALAKGRGALLILDEVQKVPNWPEMVKALWDARPGELRVVLLGSSALGLQRGLTESLAGRYELLRMLQWTYTEWSEAFGDSLEHYLVCGGYPGAHSYQGDWPRWQGYIRDSIIEPVIGQDLLTLGRVRKPALFRQSFEILSAYPAQEISYTKLLGQMQESGNVELVKNYMDLYSAAFLLHALPKYSSKPWQLRSSSPKLLPGCPALVAAVMGERSVENDDMRGRMFELAVGLEMIQRIDRISYWREGNHEVDYVVDLHGDLYAVEVKSGRRRTSKGLDAFLRAHPTARPVIIGPEGFATFAANPEAFLRAVAGPA